jgi:acetyltransferase-like isoleucine patch superfamily enzyme
VKPVLKKFLSLVALLAVMPLLLIYYIFSAVGERDGMFTAQAQLLSLIPGKIGSYLRVAFFRHSMARCDSDCFIGFGVLFSQSDTDIHSGSYIGPQCNIGRCSIGKDCLLGSGVHILSGKSQHQFDDLATPIRDQGGRFEKISIGENSWLGNGAIVMANIGKHCIVAAGSVVVNEVEDYAIVGGNPARIIKSRAPRKDTATKPG